MLQRLTHRLSAIFLVAINAAPIAWGQTPQPISLTGYNVDVVSEANTATRFAQPFDMGTAAWFETGAVDSDGATHQDGLPAGGFTSAYTNSITGGHTKFSFQPFTANNALQMNSIGVNIETLTLATPAAYRSLSVLAASGNAKPNDTSTFVLHFVDGSASAPLVFDAFDWGTGQSNIAIGGKGRNYDIGGSGRDFHYNQPVPFAMYETDINLQALGYGSKAIQSLTFTGLPDTGTVYHPRTNVFAISGAAVPEPSGFALLTVGVASAIGLLARRKPLLRAHLA